MPGICMKHAGQMPELCMKYTWTLQENLQILSIIQASVHGLCLNNVWVEFLLNFTPALSKHCQYIDAWIMLEICKISCIVMTQFSHFNPSCSMHLPCIFHASVFCKGGFPCQHKRVNHLIFFATVNLHLKTLLFARLEEYVFSLFNFYRFRPALSPFFIL